MADEPIKFDELTFDEQAKNIDIQVDKLREQIEKHVEKDALKVEMVYVYS